MPELSSVCAWILSDVCNTTFGNSKDEPLLREYLRKISDRLQRFIAEGQVRVDTKYWQDKLAEIENQNDPETED